ncbi:MAG TPA: hypothetical protein VGP63_14905 [Planctomycetaceae bacterium]|jgi:hypothetical protein|nr:hypothetical protein [Planctomycetaceae bacterium]
MIKALVIQPMQGFALVKYGWALSLPPTIAYWSFGGAAIGLAALFSPTQKRRFLWPLRILVRAMILTDALFVDSRDSLATWLTLPLIWLVRPTGYGPRPTEWFFRLLLPFTACLQPIQIFPFPGSQIRIGTMSTLVVGVAILVDLYHDLKEMDSSTSFEIAWRSWTGISFWRLWPC